MSGLKVKMGEIEVSLDIDPEKGAADSGDLESDLPNLLVAVAEAADERRIPVALLIDELQYFNQKELSALIMASIDGFLSPPGDEGAEANQTWGCPPEQWNRSDLQRKHLPSQPRGARYAQGAIAIVPT